jgi:hypothetical protein
MKNTLFISVSSIKERTGLHANVDDKLVLPEIKTAQDMYIHPLLGSGLYERLQDGIDANNLTADEVALLDNFVTDTLIYYVLSELPTGLSYQFYNKGLVRKTSDNTDQPQMQDLLDISARYRKRAEFYAERMVKFLKQNAAQGKYNLYLNPGSGLDAIHPDNSAYSTTIYLGDCEGCGSGLSFEEKYQGQTGFCC